MNYFGLWGRFMVRGLFISTLFSLTVCLAANATDMAGRTLLDLVQGPTYVNQLLPSANDAEAHINNMLEIDMKTKMNKIGSLLRKHGGKTSEELKAEH